MHLNSQISDLRLRRIQLRARAASEIPFATSIAAGPAPGSPATAPPIDGTIRGNDRRRSPRVRVESEILVRRVGGFNVQVGVRNASSGGCRVELIEDYEVGDPVIARFPKLEPLGSRVSWTKGKTAGIQFLTKIHPAVFDALVKRLAS
jgi:hypothetical protein